MTTEHDSSIISTRSGLLVFTDLDGTLLDDSYRWNAASEALQALSKVDSPLILSSSKTLEELRELARELNTCAPLVVENGAIIAFPKSEAFREFSETQSDDPDYYVHSLGTPRKELVTAAHTLRELYGYRFEGFADWDAERVCKETGLTEKAARLSLMRLGTEPILWMDTEVRWEEFLSRFEQAGYRCVKGGRFIHLMGAVDKVLGLHRIAGTYRQLEPQKKWTVVALGDSPNDLGMLSAADIAVVIPNPRHPAGLEPTAPQVFRATHPGPAGWNEVMNQIIELYLNR